MRKSEIIDEINKLCKKYDRKNYPGIAIGVIKEGEVIFSGGYGEANLDYNIPIDENTVFHGCSMTKQFTAACIALLIEEGRLSLDQDITSIFPELKNYRGITIYNLLYMTNGIPDIYDTAYCVCGIRDDEGITLEEFWRNVKACDWTFFKPGEKWSYGNTGYFLLGQIIQAITKTSLSQYADEHIFKPLGMNSTFIRDDHTKIIKNRAVGYSNYNQVHFNDSYTRYTSRHDELSINQENVEVGGAGQIWTTLNDMFLWNNNFYNNILGKASGEFKRFLTTSGLLNNGEKCGYGLGLFIDDFYGNKIVYHGGWAGGYSAYYAQLPEMKSSLIILGNHTDFEYDFGYKNGGLTENILKLLIEYKDNEREKESDNINLKPQKCDLNLCGKYINQESCCLWNITKKNDNYYIEDSLWNNTEIFYVGNNTFKSKDKEKIYAAVQNNNHNIEYIELWEGNDKSIFYPCYKNKIDEEKLKLYEGSYYCKKLHVSYSIEAYEGRLFVRNENFHNNALDIYYINAIEDTFISDNNSYMGKVCITFSRDLNKKIVSFSYRDDELTLRENLKFIKIK